MRKAVELVACPVRFLRRRSIRGPDRRRRDGLLIDDDVTFLTETIADQANGAGAAQLPHVVGFEPDVDDTAARRGATCSLESPASTGVVK